MRNYSSLAQVDFLHPGISGEIFFAFRIFFNLLIFCIDPAEKQKHWDMMGALGHLHYCPKQEIN
jgi:hypothetical protein